jgi:hypothetical protein
LPDKIRIEITTHDVENAICGSPTRCTIANAIRRMFPKSSWIAVNPNRITITYENMYHHFNMPNAGLKIVKETDNGTLVLGKRREITISSTDKPTPVPVHTKERQVQVNAARQARKDAGKPDKKYDPNPRLLAARRAGMAYKHLSAA